MRANFIGQFPYSIDPKNRLFIPPRFREELQKEGKGYFVLTLGPDDCLMMYLPSEWEQVLVRLDSANLADKEAGRAFKRLLMAKAQEVEVDSQGRILVPQLLKEEGGLKKDVLIIGQGNKIELWDSTRWAAKERASKKLALRAYKSLEI